MRKLLLILTLAVSIPVCAQTLDAGWYKSYIDKNREIWKVPGLSFGIMNADTLLFAYGSGVCTEGKKEKTDASTLFGIASNTKAFTAAAVGLLVQQGKLQWDDKVKKYLPWFALYDEYVSDAFTIRDLLTHHSGLQTFSGDLIWYASDHSRQEIVERARYLKPVYGFRENFGYSNIMYLTAGLVIEKVSGKTYDEFIAENFFQPLEMKATNSTIRKNPATNVASPHTQAADKNIPIPYVNWDNIAPAGSINSSVQDLSHWVNMWLNNGQYHQQQIIQPRIIQYMWNVVTPRPVSIGSAGARGEIQMNGYGCGWNIMIYKGVRVVHHSGGLDGMVSHTVLLPDKKLGFVILTNAGSGLAGSMIYDIIDHLCGFEEKNYVELTHGWMVDYQKKSALEEAKKEKEHNKNKKPTLDPMAYAGTYSGNVYGSVTVNFNKSKELFIQFDHTKTFHARLENWEGDTFSFTFEEHPSLPRGYATFILNEDGKSIRELKLDLPNPDFDFTELDLVKK